MKALNKNKEILKDKLYSWKKENFKDSEINDIEKNQINLVDLGLYKNNTSFGAYYAYYKNKNKEWINSHAETKKVNTDLIANNLKKIIFIFFRFKPSSLLDIGCGAGHITNSLQNILKLKKSVGIDVSEYAIKYGKKWFKNVSFKQNYLKNLSPKNTGKFDIVYSRECYPFVRNNKVNQMVNDIKNISKLLKFNGLIVFETYSYKKGINVKYNKIKKKLLKSHKMIKIIKYPNQFYELLNLIKSKNSYLLFSILVKILYNLINRHPTYYVILKVR